MVLQLLEVSRSQGAIRHLYRVLAHLGGFGLLLVSVIDSSPLMVPFGNDLLLIAMSVRKHNLVVYYALMAACGSVLGCLMVDALSRKSGEKGFRKTVSHKRFDYIKRHLKKNAAWTLALASFMPPPFPFTVFVAGTAAFQFPRKKLLVVLCVSRFARFLVEGLLAVWFGQRLLRFARSPVLGYLVAAVIVVSIAGSALAIRSWIKRSKGARATA
jgi:membrane protein YqaA with SNARE-associated domain